jgi:kynurenine formamidase
VTLAKDGYNMNRWLLVEHTGTHMDAPIHFGDGVQSADQIPAEHLVVPLAIIDIRAKTQDDPDAQLTPDDLKAFEAEHGPIPDGACVAMLSGWDARATGPEFRNADADGVMHFPGFHVEAAQYLMGERNGIGIAVDTLSLDYGKSAEFATHYAGCRPTAGAWRRSRISPSCRRPARRWWSAAPRSKARRAARPACSRCSNPPRRGRCALPMHRSRGPVRGWRASGAARGP